MQVGQGQVLKLNSSSEKLLVARIIALIKKSQRHISEQMRDDTMGFIKELAFIGTNVIQSDAQLLLYNMLTYLVRSQRIECEVI